jgi:hypothetical protein
MSRAYNTLGPGGASTLTPPMSSYVNSYLLEASAVRDITWPTGMQFCNITGGGYDYYARAEGEASVPSGDVLDGTASARNPGQRQRGENEQSFSIISETEQVITVEFWRSA